MSIRDEKYIVFKREDWDKRSDVRDPEPVPDAVVIRKQDAFAQAGLRGYAYAMLTAMDMLPLTEEARANLTETADYFMLAASEAAVAMKKLPD